VSIPDKRVTEKDVHYGVMDRSGALIYPFTLDEKVEFWDRVATTVQDGRYGAIDTDGNTCCSIRVRRCQNGGRHCSVP
jgi:hypothetical protein